MIDIRQNNTDDSDFIDLIETFVERLLASISPSDLYLIKIDSWFDFKWRGFQGKLLGAAGIRAFDKLRIPPFIPDRVLEQRHFERDNGGYYEGSEPLLHFYQSSSDNLTRKTIYAATEPRLFLWYSGGTQTTKRGSIMTYIVEKSNQRTFYIGLTKKIVWQTLKTDGISRNEAKSLLEQPTGVI